MNARARAMPWLFLAGWFWLAGAAAQTPTPPMPPAPPELAERLKKLETELRCLVCQNQTLADSPAGLAGDLRREIRLLADAGKTDEEIKEHLRARYGDYVLYRPVVGGKTLLLWFGPFALLIGGALLLWSMSRRRGALAGEPPLLSGEETARAKALLGGGRIVEDSAAIRDLLASARVIAVVGLSAKTHRPSHEVAAYLQRAGYRIIPVNPNETAVLGEKCHSDLRSVAEKIDIVDCFRKSGEIAAVVEDAIAVGARCVWMQLGVVDREAAERAAGAGLDVVMDRCTKIEHAALIGR